MVFVSGNMPFKTEIAPVLIVRRLEEFAYAEATAIAVVLLIISFVMLGVINLLERWSNGTMHSSEAAYRRFRLQPRRGATRLGPLGADHGRAVDRGW